MPTTTLLTSLRTLFDFETEPVLQENTAVWSGCFREGVTLSEDTLVDAIEALLPSWPCDAAEPWIFWTSAPDHALLLLNPEDGSIELQLYESAQAFEDAVSLLSC